MNPLNERLDDVGWNDADDWREPFALIFKWMQQATSEIDRLQDRIERLEEEADA